MRREPTRVGLLVELAKTNPMTCLVTENISWNCNRHITQKEYIFVLLNLTGV